ncbi:MAG: hypothetical protein WCA94_11725 [Candidatus Acidiferrum sp.]
MKKWLVGCISMRRRKWMLMVGYARLAGTRLYAVEVSGWDSTQSFFVERCELAWNEEFGKRVALKRTLQGNATLFVRLLQTSEADRSHPVVYEAELIGRTETGLKQFRLSAVTPRLQEVESPVAG